MNSSPPISLCDKFWPRGCPVAFRAAGLTAGLLLLGLGGPGLAAGSPCIADEPTDYRMSEFRTAVPCTLAGATVIATQHLQEMLRLDAPLLIDVFPAPRVPKRLRDEHLWLPPTRHSLPGAVWLPNTGFGVLPIEEERYFRANLEQLTGGNRTRTIVFFCLADCWMSWNAARRAVSWGYEAVIWYPDGVDGWEAVGLPLAELSPVGRTEGQ